MNRETIEFIGKDKYNELLKKYNLCTKKWTYGRTKAFYKEVDKLIKKKVKEEVDKLIKKKEKEVREKMRLEYE